VFCVSNFAVASVTIAVFNKPTYLLTQWLMGDLHHCSVAASRDSSSAASSAVVLQTLARNRRLRISAVCCIQLSSASPSPAQSYIVCAWTAATRRTSGKKRDPSDGLRWYLDGWAGGAQGQHVREPTRRHWRAPWVMDHGRTLQLPNDLIKLHTQRAFSDRKITD